MIEHSILNNKNTIKSVVKSDEEMVDLLTQTFEIPESFNSQVIEVTDDYIARPDLISLAVYGTDKYADVICKINGISNPFELNNDTILLVPDVSDIWRFQYTEPASLENEDEDESSTPKAKAKQEKRSANDAVIGDKRFTIDDSRKIVIY